MSNKESNHSSFGDSDEAAQPLNQYVVRPGLPFPPTPGDQEPYLVAFADDDAEKPINWGIWRRVLAKGIASASITFVAWGSSAISPGLGQIREEFHIGEVASVLAVSLYVLGFATGPVLWGPGSELYGRRWPLIVGMFGFTVFGFACATAKDVQTLMLCRFFMGAFGCSTLVVGPAISADCFNTFQRGKAVSAVILCLVAGPMVAPVVSGYIVNSYLRWRWTMYVTGIMGALGLLSKIFFLQETYPQIVLRDRAQMIRKETGNWAVSAPIEGMEIDFRNILHRTVLKPFRMLMVEPILLLISLYHGFIYGILYLCLLALPYTFESVYGWHGGNEYLPYLGMFIGSVLVVVINILVFEPLTKKMVLKRGRDVYPESRLPLMVLCGFVFPAGIFMLFWTGRYHVHWMAPTVGAGLLGFGLIGIFLAALNYVIDTYLIVAASGIAANTFTRSGMGAGFPLFALQMFKNLGIQWAGTLLGCLALLLAPAPVCFLFFGPWIRSKSKYAVGDDDQDREDLMLELSADPQTRGSLVSMIV